jgi:hypothetical protein
VTTSLRFITGKLVLEGDPDSVDWLVLYRGRSEREELGPLPLLHLGSWGDIGAGAFSTTVSAMAPGSGVKRNFSTNATEFASLMMSMPSAGVFEIGIVSSQGAFVGWLCNGESDSPLVPVANRETFYGHPKMCVKKRVISEGTLAALEIGGSVLFIAICLISLNIWRHSLTGWIATAKPEVISELETGFA